MLAVLLLGCGHIPAAGDGAEGRERTKSASLHAAGSARCFLPALAFVPSSPNLALTLAPTFKGPISPRSLDPGDGRPETWLPFCVRAAV